MDDLGVRLRQRINQTGLQLVHYRLLAMLVLALLVVGSAQMVVYSSFKARSLVNQFHQLEQRHDALQIAWSQLLLEQSSWAAHSRIETMVREQLDMQVPAPQQIRMIKP
jgi:cell division protein FtsL